MAEADEKKLWHDGVGIAQVVGMMLQALRHGREPADEVDHEQAEDGVASELVERCDAAVVRALIMTPVIDQDE